MAFQVQRYFGLPRFVGTSCFQHGSRSSPSQPLSCMLACCHTNGAHRLPSVRYLRVKASSHPRHRSQAPTTKHHNIWATNKAWMLKFSHENGYLSWTRNAAICAGVGATLEIIEEGVPMAEDFAIGFVDLGLLFLTFGSVQHLYTAFQLRRYMQISPFGFTWILFYTSVIGLLYYGLIQSKFKLISSGDRRLEQWDGDSEKVTKCSRVS